MNTKDIQFGVGGGDLLWAWSSRMKVTGTRKTGGPMAADPAMFPNHPSLEDWASSLARHRAWE